MVDPPTFVGHSRLRSAKAEALRAKEGASADSAEEMKNTTGVNPGRLHWRQIGPNNQLLITGSGQMTAMK